MKTTILDLETISHDPLKLLSEMPPFDSADVKLGNLKDPAKIDAKLRESEERHTRNYLEKAALDARTCHIKLAGLKDADTGHVTVFAWEPDDAIAFKLTAEFPTTGKATVLPFRNESDMLAMLFAELQLRICSDADRCVTYYGNKFDLPRIFQRSWILGNKAPIPFGWRRGRYWSDRFIDLHELFTFGDREFHTGGLDGIGKALGCQTKKTGTGEAFGDLYRQDPVAAVRYLIADLDLIHEAAGKVGALANAHR